MKAKKSAMDAAIPTVKLGPVTVHAQTVKTKVKAKTKSRPVTVAKPNPKARKVAKVAKVAKPAARPAARLDQVPAGMEPPEIKDTQPRPVAKPKYQAANQRPTTVKHEHDEEHDKVAQLEQPLQPMLPIPPTPTPPTDGAGLKPTLVPSIDHRPVQGAKCTWIGTMGEAADDDLGIPVCPHCHGHLLTVAGGRENMELGFESYELGAYTSVNPIPRPHPGYREFMYWVLDQSRETCWPTPEEAAGAYYKATGKKVDPTR